MVKSMQITKASIRGRLVIDLEASMSDPQDHDFSPRANIEGSTLHISNEGGEASTSLELDSDQISAAERDRMIEMRVKFSVEGMHGVLTHKTPMPMTGPNAKKLAEPRWKTLLPLSM